MGALKLVYGALFRGAPPVTGRAVAWRFELARGRFVLSDVARRAFCMVVARRRPLIGAIVGSPRSICPAAAKPSARAQRPYR